MIIAIDPGPEKSAVIVWNQPTRFLGYCHVLQNEDALAFVRHTMLSDHASLAVEMVACYGMPVGAEVFETCLLIGRLQEIASTRSLPTRLVYRREVKMHLCGNMRAKDANIRQSLIDKFGPVGTKKAPGKLYGIKSHLWSALAVAVTAAETKETI